MNRAAICIPRILTHEGGCVDHPRDPGGATNRGITIATFRRYIKPDGMKENLRRLTEAQAVVVYKPQYWDAVMADSLPVSVDCAVADYAMNSGPTRSAKYLQAIAGVAQDGEVGPATIAAVNAMPPRVVIERLCDDRLAFMRRARDREAGDLLWPTFGGGWAKRVARVRRDAIADVGFFVDAHPSPPLWKSRRKTHSLPSWWPLYGCLENDRISTLLFNFAVGILPLLEMSELTSMLPAAYLNYYIIAVALANVGLRIITTTPVGWSG